MANNFATDTNCQALFNFESGALTTDSGPVGTNTLVATGTPSADATNYKQGAAAVVLASGQGYTIADASLSANFPLKTGDATKKATFCGWFRITTLGWNCFFSKRPAGQGFWVGYAGSQISLYWPYNSGGSYETWSTGKALTVNQWYHITVMFDGVAKTATIYVWDVTGNAWTVLTHTFTNTFYIDASGYFGVGLITGGGVPFVGQIDEAVVFNRLLNYAEVVKIKNQLYSGPYSWSSSTVGWCVDPVNGADINSGTDFADAFKTLYKTFAAGDIINVAKCAETQQQTGATATKGSASVTGISGWTPAQYNIIRFVGDDMLYMVKSFAGSTITLYRPYRGTTGAGTKTINLLTLFTQASSNDLNPQGAGTVANNIILKGGVNTSNFAQDGFSLWNGGNSYYPLWNMTLYTFSRVGCYYNPNTYAGPYTWDRCTGSLIFYFRTYGQYYNSPHCYACNFQTIVSEMGGLYAGNCWGTTWNDIDSYDSAFAPFGINSGSQNVLNRPRLNSAGGGLFWPGSASLDVTVNDPVLDEFGTGAPFISLGTAVTLNTYELKVNNPTIPAINNLISLGSGAMFYGHMEFSNINGVATDYRKFNSWGEGQKMIAQTSRDQNVYNAAAPSARVYLYGSVYPVIHRFYIPLDAGVAKTLSVFFFKNSNPISTATLNTAGSGYAVGDLISVTQAGGGGAIIQVVTLSGSGVATFTVLQGGYNYSVANGLNTTTMTGGGSGCKINITAVGTGYGSITLPTMRLHWITGSAGAFTTNIYDTVMPNTNNAWSQVSHAITPSIDAAVLMELIFQSTNAGAIAWYDDIGVS